MAKKIEPKNENNNQSEGEELEIQHRLYIMEEDINVSELPTEIKQAMRNFNAKLKKYEDTEDEAEENDLFFELQQDDVNIADSILTWWEDKNSETEEEQEVEEKEEEKEEKKVVAEKKVEPKVEEKVEEKVVEQKVVEQKVEEKVIEQPKADTEEDKVRALIKDNVISVKDLTNIIGREPDYPEHKIGNILLRKQYLKAFYEVQN